MEVIHDNKKKSFYIRDEEIIAEMTYIKSGNKIIIEHTLVETKHRGEGLGNMLMGGVADFARKSGIKVTLRCPYAQKLFKDNPGLYGDIIS